MTVCIYFEFFIHYIFLGNKPTLLILLWMQVVELSKFDYRMAKKLYIDLQNMSCNANYHALQFTKSISEMGQKLVYKMLTRGVGVSLLST